MVGPLIAALFFAFWDQSPDVFESLSKKETSVMVSSNELEDTEEPAIPTLGESSPLVQKTIDNLHAEENNKSV